MLCGGTLFTCRGSVVSNCDLLTDLKICLNTIVFWKSTCDETLTLLSSWVFITTISFRLLGLFISGDHSRLIRWNISQSRIFGLAGARLFYRSDAFAVTESTLLKH